MNPRNRFFILLSIIFVIALGYYFFSTPSNKDLVLIGTVDSNQVIVSPQTQGRLQKLLVDEGTPVKAGQLIAVIDPAELQAAGCGGFGQHFEFAVEGFRHAFHRAVNARLDQQRCRECSSQAAFHDFSVGTSASGAGTHPER